VRKKHVSGEKRKKGKKEKKKKERKKKRKITKYGLFSILDPPQRRIWMKMTMLTFLTEIFLIATYQSQ